MPINQIHSIPKRSLFYAFISSSVKPNITHKKMLQTEESNKPVCYREDTQEAEGGGGGGEEEEALSLCDLPILEGREHEDTSNTANNTSPDRELFEFFSDHSADMCSADDIFVSGKLLPSKSSSATNPHQNGDRNRSFSHMRSESVDETRSSRPKYRLMRSSFSVDYQKMERVSTSKEPTQKPTRIANRSCSGKRAGIGELSSGKVPCRPKWYLLIFGSMRGPPIEMEMRDIRNRQMRQNPPSAGLFPAFERREGAISGGKEEERNVAWKLLRVLSCKGHANAAVTVPIGCVTHVPTM